MSANPLWESARAPIAIIGMSCRFPGGADSPSQFWRMLQEGVDATSEVPPDRWDLRRFYHADPDKPGKTFVRRGGFLRGSIEEFDAAFFGLSPREALALDPQQRLLLEIVVQAVEDAGLGLDDLRGSRTGVFIGGFTLDNGIQQLGTLNRPEISTYTAVGVSLAMLSNRISYTFDFRGPSVTVDTACSSSLVAAHLACQALWNGECDLAICGGVNLMFRPEYTIAFSKARVLSPDGRCKTFDAGADGYGRGEGCGVVVLRRGGMTGAERDRVRALICATGVNQDGRTPGITNPSQESQKALLREVCDRAGVDPSLVGYVEAHGTGTQAGDTTEAASIGEIFGASRNGGAPCLIGSVKTNIGHLEAAAGVAGIIKTVLCLEHEAVPRHLHLRNPNPKLDFEALRLKVPQTLEAWQGEERYAVVNSFGYGGTNATALLRSAPPPRPVAVAGDDGPYVLPFSAQSEAALDSMLERYSRFPLQGTLRDLGYTLARHRTHRPWRAAIAAPSKSALQQELIAHVRGEARVPLVEAPQPRKLAFVYTGMGAQSWGMAAELMQGERVFREAIEACDRHFQPLAGWSLRTLFTSPESFGARSGEAMAEPRFAQPANLALQVALTEVWRALGVAPDAIVGHSVGEIAAAWAAGALSLEDAIRLTYVRSTLQQELRGSGGMMSVECPAGELGPLPGGLAVAAVNGPSATTVAGELAALRELAASLASRGIAHRPLAVEVAYHSPQMDAIREPFLTRLHDLEPREPRLPLYSTVTGAAIGGSPHGGEYWWRNARQAVLFQQAAGAMFDGGCDTFLEVGPHPVLAMAIRGMAASRELDVATVASMRRGQRERDGMRNAVSTLFTRGVAVDWRVLYPEGRQIPLPDYPWQRERQWSESREARADRLGEPNHPLLQMRAASPSNEWEGEWSAVTLPYLDDHRVDGTVVFPGAGYVEACLAAIGAGEAPAVVEDVRLLRALLPESSARFRLTVDGEGLVAVHTRGDGEWALHATAHVTREALPPKSERLPLAQLRASSVPMTSSGLYEAFARLGLAYGPAFRTLRRVWRNDGAVLASLEVADSVDTGGHCIHPTLLDGAFQSLLALVVDECPEAGGVMPTRIERVRFHGRAGDRVWSCARVTRRTSDAIEGDLVLADDAGNVLVEVEGLRCTVLPRAAARETNEIDGWLYRQVWQPQARGEASAPSRLRVWVICGDGALKSSIAKRLAANGERVVRVRKGDEASMVDRYRTEGEIVVVFVCNPEHEARFDDAFAFLALAQSLTAVTLYVVTSGNESIHGGLVAGPAQGAVQGLARVLATESPTVRCTILDLDARRPEDLLPELVLEMAAPSGEAEVALRPEGRFVLRLVPASLEGRMQQVPAGGRPYRVARGARGGIDDLELQEIERREPAADEVEIEVHSASVNFKDLAKILGLLSDEYVEGTYFGSTLGLDCSGTIARTGPNVNGFAPGDRVFALAAEGCFRTHVTARTDFVFRLPESLPLDSGLGALQFAVAWQALHHSAGLRAGERVLIHSAAGGVGTSAIQVARYLGAEIFATAGTEEKRAWLRAQGIEHVADSRSSAFHDAVREWSGGRGVDVVLNSLSGELFDRSVALLAPFGRFVEIGKRDISRGRRISLAAFDRNHLFVGLDMDQMLIDRPDLLRAAVGEILALLADGKLEPVPLSFFPPGEMASALRRMERGEHIGKIGIRFRGETPEIRRSTRVVREDATYLVTGGFGGFGSEIARWLVREKGARHVVLAGRRGAQTEAEQELVRELRETGADAVALPVDVSGEGEVRAMLQTIAGMPPLRGIFHAAMLLDDALLPALTSERLEKVLAPKARGAWHLHQATLGEPLDFFVLFSSISSVIGNPGQGNYVAANAFLDALARHRRARGLPACSVNWGVLREVGVAARNEKLEQYLGALGIRSFTPKQALAALDRIVDGAPPQLGVFDVDWPKLLASDALAARASCYAGLVAGESTARESNGGWLADRIATTPPEEQQHELQLYLGRQLERILQISPDRIGVQSTLGTLGVDSLTAFELVATIRRETAVELPFMKMMDLSVGGLAGELLQRMRGSSPAMVAR